MGKKQWSFPCLGKENTHTQKTVPKSPGYEVEKPKFKSKKPKSRICSLHHTTSHIKASLNKRISSFPTGRSDPYESSQQRTRINLKDSMHHNSLILTSTHPADLFSKHAASGMNGRKSTYTQSGYIRKITSNWRKMKILPSSEKDLYHRRKCSFSSVDLNCIF